MVRGEMKPGRLYVHDLPASLHPFHFPSLCPFRLSCSALSLSRSAASVSFPGVTMHRPNPLQLGEVSGTLVGVAARLRSLEMDGRFPVFPISLVFVDHDQVWGVTTLASLLLPFRFDLFLAAEASVLPQLGRAGGRLTFSPSFVRLFICVHLPFRFVWHVFPRLTLPLAILN